MTITVLARMSKVQKDALARACLVRSVQAARQVSLREALDLGADMVIALWTPDPGTLAEIVDRHYDGTQIDVLIAALTYQATVQDKG